MKYQLVLQLGDSSKAAYDKMIELEDLLIEQLGDLGYVDGHDWGSGTTNIFIHTDDPKSAFNRIQTLPGARSSRAGENARGSPPPLRTTGSIDYINRETALPLPQMDVWPS